MKNKVHDATFFPPAKKLININATSQYFSIKETVTEDKAVKRLTDIRKMYEREHKTRNKDGALKVKIAVANPEIF